MASQHILLTMMLLAALPAQAAKVTQTNLTSDGAVKAAVIDPNLKNPWGMSYAPGGAFWVSDNATGLATLYNSSGSIIPLVVTIPAAGGGAGAGSPTGQVYNGTSDFVVSQGGKSGPASFIFATEDGTISGWSGSVNPNTAVVAVDNSATGAVYKGLAFYTNSSGQNFLLATDFRAGLIDVFDANFNLVASFRDPMMAKSYSPYNIAILGGNIFVTYAVVDKARHDSVSGPGKGALEEITPAGQVLVRFMHGQLNAPWGLALAPAGWGNLTGDILVGNFGSGWISAFTTALAPRGLLKNTDGSLVFIDGLWGLIPGNGGSGGSTNEIYFSAGTNNETDGLFGSLTFAQ